MLLRLRFYFSNNFGFSDDFEQYDQGNKNGTDLMIALRGKEVIFKASDEVWYYDKFVPILEAVEELGLKDELLQEISGSGREVHKQQIKVMFCV